MRDLLAWLRPEARLFLATARRDVTPTELAALVGAGFQWPLLEVLATRELATAGVAARLRSLPPGVVPEDVLRRLGAAAMVVEFRMRSLEQALRAAAATLTGVDVRVLLLKGAALGVTVYQDFTDRGMQDLDVLVAPDQEQRAWQALLDAGWVPAYPEQTGPFYAQHQHRVPLVAPRLGNARLELHTRLFHGGGPFAVTAEDVLRDAVPLKSSESLVLVPSQAHSLLYLCQHFAWTHGMERGILRTVRDLDALWRATGGFDASFARLARTARAVTCCYWTLRLGRHLFGVPVAPDLLEALRPPRSSRVLDLLERHFASIAGLAPVPCPSVRLQRALWTLGLLPHWSGHGDIRPWTAGAEWAAVAPAAGEGTAGGWWSRGRAALVHFGRYAGALLGS